MHMDTPPYDNVFLANENKSEEKTDEQILKLQEDLAAECDKRREERFAWLVACVILLDGLVFSHECSWIGCLLVFLLEIAGLILLSRRWGLEEIEKYLCKLERKTTSYFLTRNNQKPSKIKQEKEAA